MGIVIFTQIFFISPGRLLADVGVALFICARSGGTNLLDGAGLASIAIGTACRVALGIGALFLQRIQTETALAHLGDTFRILTIPCLPAGELGAVIGFRTACFCCVSYAQIVFNMGIVLARRGLAYAFHANSSLRIIKRIAIDRSGRLSIGTGRCAVQLTHAFVCEMMSACTSRNDARSALANASRGVIRRVTVQALRAAVLVLVDTGIVQQAFVAGTGVDNTLPILTKLVGFALRVTIAAVQWIIIKLVFD